MPTPQPILVDTDVSLGTPGAEVDDGAALMVLARRFAGSVLAVTTVFGNVRCELAAQNAARLVAWAEGPDWPIYGGAAWPLEADTSWLLEWQRRYGPTPDWNHNLPAVEASKAIIRAVRANPGQLTILALGPLTNLALALQQAPDIAPMVTEVVAMGGTFASAPVPEFNFRCDPEAARAVLQAGWPVRLLGLDITRRVLFTRQDFESLPGLTGAQRLLKRQAPGWIDTVEEQGWAAKGCALHDAIAVAALADSSLFAFVEARVAVDGSETSQPGLARVQRESAGKTNVRVAAQIDVPGCHRWVMEALSEVPG